MVAFRNVEKEWNFGHYTFMRRRKCRRGVLTGVALVFKIDIYLVKIKKV